MQRIEAVDAFSVAKYAAIFYVPMGLLYYVELVLFKIEMVTVPFGFYFAYLHLTVNFHLPLPRTYFGASALVVIGSSIFAATGWITGFACANVYNFFAARFGGLRVGVRLEGEPAIQGQMKKEPSDSM